MKKILATTLFMLATLAWASAQQAGSMPQQGGGAATSPGSQMPGAAQQMPGAAQQAPGAAQSQPTPGDQPISAPVTEGCLGGSDPNYTITDKTGSTYKLNIPPNANTAVLAQHVGEPVRVAGNVNGAGKAGNGSIDVQGIGKGTSSCPATGSSGAQTPAKQ